MSRTEDRSLANRVGDLERTAARLQPVHVVTTIIVCGRSEPWAAAITCAASLNRLLEGEGGHPAPGDPRPVEELRRFLDLELLIDPRSGTRKLKSKENAEAFEALVEKYAPELVEIFITVHEAQVDPLLSEATLVGFLGGNRAGKTRIGLYWLIRQWMIRGGPGRLFWIIAPTLAKAHARIGKPGDSPSAVTFANLLPERLRASSLPTHERGKLQVTFIDGSVLEGHHGFGDGDNLKSERVDALLADEVAAMPALGVWHQLNARTLQGGRAFLATTPKAGHWCYDKVVLAEPHSGGQIDVYSVDLFQNPWLTSAEIFAQLLKGAITATELEEIILPSSDRAAACRALVEDPTSLREDFGKWTVEGTVLWSEWSDIVAKTCTVSGAGLGPSSWPAITAPHGHVVAGQQLPNITEHIAARFFREEPLQVWGEDFNVNPQSCVRVQVHGIHSRPETWTLFVIEEVQTRGTIEAHGARMQRTAPGACISCDPSGDIPRTKQDATDGDEAAVMRKLGFNCRSAVGRGHRLGSQRPTINILHRLTRQRRLVIHTRCRQTLRAMQLQRAKPDGRIDKRAGVNSASDQQSSTTDALRYIAWPLFEHEAKTPAKVTY